MSYYLTHSLTYILSHSLTLSFVVVDIVSRVIPLLCQEFPVVHFIIGGDGPKKLLLEEMIERHQLHDRVELLGAVAHDKVRDVSHLTY